MVFVSNLYLIFAIIVGEKVSLETISRYINGWYTKGITDYEVILPRKVKENGAFHSYKIYHSYGEHVRKKRSVTEADKVHYQISLDGVKHHIEMTPNPTLTSPGMLVETHAPNLTEHCLRTPTQHLCHYHGYLRGFNTSRVALSVCSGLTGVIRLGSSVFYIEPVEGQEPEENGEHLHVVYKRSIQHQLKERCSSRNDWWNAWAEEMYLAAKRFHKRSDVRESVPRYLELCVVSDLKFIEHHKTLNIEEYVLTIMNMVADFYHDESVGNLIDVVVVRLVFLKMEKEELDLSISKDAQKTLDSFCKWQIGINPKDPEHPNHHDIAVLLTRYDICSNSKAACNLLGLAYVGTACNPTKNCCINEDNGLMLGATVAHELGHNLGCSHDTLEDSGCSGKALDGTDTLMSPSVGHKTTIWSNCSRDFISNLFMNQMGECLLDEPKDHNYLTSDMPVGAVYDADQQCKFLFGDNYIRCNIGGDKICEKLWCKELGKTRCVSRGRSLADGTSCGTNKWCYNDVCIPIGERPKAVDGGWSDWGLWTTCSRTCGGGTSVRQRLCTAPKPSHGGKYCLGTKREYKMCNTESCPTNSSTFRETQCAAHNKKPFKGHLYSWVPYPAPESDPNPCALYCINEKRTLVKLEPRALDGTRCYPGKKDTCIHGTCLRVGCDWGIESTAVEDNCGICNGDGTRCTIQSGVYDSPNLKGYVKIVDIPKLSKNIDIAEMKPAENMLALGFPNGTIFFNANFTERSAAEYMMGGVRGIYTKPEADREELHIKGPLAEDIVLYYVFFSSYNPGVKYSFVVPQSQPAHSPHYHWEFIEWGECSAKCGGGTEISKPSCLETLGGRVKDSFCSDLEKLEPKTRSCNLQKCRRRWKTWAWSECSGCMFRTGERHREVECVMELPSHSDGDEVIVDPSECCGEAPIKKELCDSSKPCSNTTEDKEDRRRWTNRLDDEFINFSYDLVGVEDFVAKLFKRSPKLNGSQPRHFENDASPIVEDHIAPSDIVLLTAQLSESNANFLMNISELEFEDVGDKIPMFVMGNEKVYRGEEAIAMLNENSMNVRNEKLKPKNETKNYLFNKQFFMSHLFPKKSKVSGE